MGPPAEIQLTTTTEAHKGTPPGRLLEGKTLDELGRELLDHVIAVASGKQTRSEENGFHDLAIFKQGVTL